MDKQSARAPASAQSSPENLAAMIAERRKVLASRLTQSALAPRGIGDALEIGLRFAQHLWAQSTDASGAIVDIDKAREAAMHARAVLPYTTPRVMPVDSASMLDASLMDDASIIQIQYISLAIERRRRALQAQLDEEHREKLNIAMDNAFGRRKQRNRAK